MKKSNFLKSFFCIALSMLLALSFTGCSKVKAENLMQNITANEPTVNSLDIDSAVAGLASDFAVRLYKACSKNGQNTLVSPLSVLSALSMTANGANGETLSQMEKALGIKSEDLNMFFYKYMQKTVKDQSA